MMDSLRAGPAQPGDDLGSGFELKGKHACTVFSCKQHFLGLLNFCLVLSCVSHGAAYHTSVCKPFAAATIVSFAPL